MARPRKIGLDYFPLDTIFDSDVEMLEEEFGNDGLSVLIKTWQALFRTKEGTINCSAPAMQKIMASRSRISPRKWNDIVTFAAKLGLFDEQLWHEKIIFSSGVARRLLKVSEERNSPVENKQLNEGFQGINSNNGVPPISDNSEIGAESKEKEKESKEKEIENESKGDETEPPRAHGFSLKEVSLEFHVQGIINSDEPQKFFDHYDGINWVRNGSPIVKLKPVVSSWIRRMKEFELKGQSKFITAKDFSKPTTEEEHKAGW